MSRATGKIATPETSTSTRAMAKPYESDITRFIRELKAKSPEIERKQRDGRAIWWDKEHTPDELRRFRESNVPQQGYVYQTKG